MTIDTPTYDEIKLWRQQNPCSNLASKDKIFQGADFDHHHRKFRDLVRQVFRFHRGIRQTLKGLNAHYMRHLMCTNLVDKGVSIEQVSHIIGHKDVKTTNRYVTKIRTKAQAVKGLASLLRNEPLKKDEPVVIPKRKREVKARGKKAVEEEEPVPDPETVEKALDYWRKPLIKVMKGCLTGKEGTAVLYDLGAGRDAHDLHRQFAKIKALSKAVYLDH